MIFDIPEMRAAFIELYGTDKHGAKYKIGDTVTFTAADENTYTGKVQAVNFTDETFEYLIENSPLLAWESLLRAV